MGEVSPPSPLQSPTGPFFDRAKKGRRNASLNRREGLTVILQVSGSPCEIGRYLCF